MRLGIFCLPLKNGITLIPQYLKPENPVERFFLISTFVLHKYSLIVRKLVGIKQSELDFLRRIPLKTQEITLVHSLPDDELLVLMNKLRKISSKSHIIRTGAYFYLLPAAALFCGSFSLPIVTGLSILCLRDIQLLKGSLVLQKLLKNSALTTSKTLDLDELKDLDKFEKDNRIFLLRETYTE